MASVIGESHEKGLRSTVRSHWMGRMGVQQQAFLEAPRDARRENVVAFVDLRDKRDAQDQQLGALYQSLLDLAAAHAALAHGSIADLDTAIGRIQHELDVTLAVDRHFKSLKREAKTKKEDE